MVEPAQSQVGDHERAQVVVAVESADAAVTEVPVSAGQGQALVGHHAP